jgi:hypothetical protein
MKTLTKSISIMFTISLFFTANALALPIAGNQVLMEANNGAPYMLTDLADDNQAYKSFCLESQNYFTPGLVYTVDSIGDYAEGGGAGAVNGRDKVSDESKWLYAAYMSDVFVGVDAQKVQNAIWYLEGEAGGTASDWKFLSTFTFDNTGWTVVAVNLALDGADNQSQLIGVAPVPEAATMLFLGTGLIGIAGLGRKK